MSNERAEELIRKYLEGKTTPEEEALLEGWYLEMAADRPEIAAKPDYEKIAAEIWQPLLAVQAGQPIPKPSIRLWPRVVAAASVLILLTLGTLYVFRKDPVGPVAQQAPPVNDILPAGALATLTLSDGRKIPLDSISNKKLAHQQHADIGTIDGRLVYTITKNSPVAPQEESNTLTTHPGEHYSIELADGTKAWLDASSSITYPVAFSGSERKVSITGEVYFEIVHDPKRPFYIAVKDQQIEDIGTRLNINSYDDEPILSTTLLEGSVRVVKGKRSVILKPGQQATRRPGDSAFHIRPVDPMAAVAWKNGYFLFDSADIKTVMRQIARWYNVEVIYKGELPKRTFKGKFYRDIKASEAFSILSYFGAHFHIEGKTVTVSS